MSHLPDHVYPSGGFSFNKIYLAMHATILSPSTFCEEVGVIKKVHLLSSEVRSVTTALKVVEEVQEKVREIKDE